MYFMTSYQCYYRTSLPDGFGAPRDEILIMNRTQRFKLSINKLLIAMVTFNIHNKLMSKGSKHIDSLVIAQ